MLLNPSRLSWSDEIFKIVVAKKGRGFKAFQGQRALFV